jgi:FkbM family methyltransferase
MPVAVNNFTVIESVYGRFVVNRHCAYQAEALIKTGLPHIESELRMILAIAGSLPEGALAVDAGANIGLVAIPLALALRAVGGSVLAFEAQRMMFYAMCGAAALNDLENLQAFHLAVGARAGRIKVPPLDYGSAQDFGMLSLVGGDPSGAGEEIAVTAIDSMPLPRLDFLKIDVEGMEIEVLEGAAASLRAHRPWCWVEYWKVGIGPVKDSFKGLPYRFFQMDQLNLLCAPTERLAAGRLSIDAPEV